jgi:hypothetical protein
MHGPRPSRRSSPDPDGTEAAPAAVVAVIEAGVGAVAGECVLVVDGEPGADPSPAEVLAAVRVPDWQDRVVASLFSNPVIITYVDPDNVQLARSTDDRLLPRVGENVRLGRTPYVVERIGYDIPTDSVERVWIVCRPA